MSLQSVLLTGATGNVGAIVLEQLLAAGITVDAVLRSFANSKMFLEQRYPNEVANGNLRFTEIPDMNVGGVFDAPAKKVSAIIHVATPLSSSNFLETMIEPALRINQNVLQAAERSPTIKRVIITGSIVSVMKLPEDLLKDATFSEHDFNNTTLQEAITSHFSAYQYSKVSSELKAWEFMKGTHSFDLVYLLAPSIIGRSTQQGFKPTRDGDGGTSSIYRECFDRDALGSIFPFVMDVDDVARTHVKSLQISAVPGNKRYLFVGGKVTAAQLANKVRANYPALQSRVPAGKEEEIIGAKCDVSRSKSIFGAKWVDWWDSVVATVEDILEYEATHPVVF